MIVSRIIAMKRNTTTLYISIQKNLITDDEFSKKSLLQKEINKMKENLRNTENRAEKWI